MTRTLSIPNGETEPVALVSLARREIDVLRLIDEGKGPLVIARELNLTERTARDYIWRLCQGLWLSSRIELLLWARQNPHALEGKPARAGLCKAPLDRAA